MIANAQYMDGKVAVRYYQPIPKTIDVAGKKYSTNVHFGIALVLADESDVPALLNHLGGCCGGKRHVFSLATPLAIQIWNNGKY